MSLTLCRPAGFWGVLLIGSAAWAADTPGADDSSSLTELAFDDLTKLPVTSVPKKWQH